MSHSTKRQLQFWGIWAGVMTLIVAALIFLPSSPVNADELHETTTEVVEAPARTIVLTAWQVDNKDDIWVVPQHDVVALNVGEAVDWEAIKGSLACGRDFQIDAHWEGDIVRALIAAGFLYGPNNPPEDLAYGAAGLDGADPWIFYSSPDCVTNVCLDEANQTVTLSRYVWDGKAAVLTPTSSSTVELTQEQAIALGCYTPPPPPPGDEPECGTPEALACTGVSENLLFVGGGTGLAGLILFLTRNRKFSL